MKVGNIGVRKDGNMLRSGAEAYGGGIVVSFEPFVLVSESCDMRWGALDINDFEVYKNMMLSDEEMIPFLEKMDN